jgi:hypothetical protein
MKRPTGLTITAILLLLTALGTILFWLTFFADLEAQRSGELAARNAAWFAWELSFPLADAWMAVTGLVGAIGLWRMRPAGLLFSLVSGGAMVFLGLMDSLFFLQNGLYQPLTAEIAVELFIHAWTVLFGLFVIAYVWGRREVLT